METTLAHGTGGGSRPQEAHARFREIVRLFRLFRYKRAVAEGYDAAASLYDEWDWQTLWRKTEWPLLETVLGNPERVLEIGIGTGAVAERILETQRSVRRYVGIDLSKRMLDQCSHRLGDRVELIHDDAVTADLNSLRERFDFVLSCRMIGHLRSPGKLFAKVRPVLAAGGSFVVTDIDPQHDYSTTRLPTGAGRVEVPTFKHRQEDVIAAAEHVGLRLDRFYRIYEDEALAHAGVGPRSLKGRPAPLFNLFVFKLAPTPAPIAVALS